jgi:hypothetical protein
MAKRIPIDCRRLTETHLEGLEPDELTLIAQRIEVQTQALNRAMRLVANAMRKQTP